MKHRCHPLHRPVEPVHVPKHPATTQQQPSNNNNNKMAGARGGAPRLGIRSDSCRCDSPKMPSMATTAMAPFRSAKKINTFVCSKINSGAIRQAWEKSKGARFLLPCLSVFLSFLSRAAKNKTIKAERRAEQSRTPEHLSKNPAGPETQSDQRS